jgi:hypothetical protein
MKNYSKTKREFIVMYKRNTVKNFEEILLQNSLAIDLPVHFEEAKYTSMGK